MASRQYLQLPPGLQKRLRISITSIRGSVRPSVRPSVFHAFLKYCKTGVVRTIEHRFSVLPFVNSFIQFLDLAAFGLNLFFLQLLNTDCGETRRRLWEMFNCLSRCVNDFLFLQLLNTDCGEHRRRLWEMFSRHETAGDMGLAMKRRMASFRMARMMNEVKNVEKDILQKNFI